MRLRRTLSGHAATLALALLTLAAPSAWGASDRWAVKGTLSDACQCTVFCSCEMGEKPTHGHCEDTAVLDIASGHYGGVDLSGLQAVAVFKSPAGERLVDTVGNLDFAHYYIPEEATDEQADALIELTRMVFGVFVDGSPRLSANETVRRVPIEASFEPRRHRVKIPNVLDLDIEAVVGWDGESPVTVTNGPAQGPGQSEMIVARSHRYRYTDHGLDWRHDGRSASMRTLDLEGAIEPATSGR